MLQTRICCGFHRPMSTHLSRIGTAAQAEEHRAAEHDRPQVDVDQARAGRDPLEALHSDDRGQGGVAEEEQELQRSAEDVLAIAGPSRRLDGAAGVAGSECRRGAGVGVALVRAAARLRIVGCL